jgi:hypothetical protein
MISCQLWHSFAGKVNWTASIVFVSQQIYCSQLFKHMFLWRFFKLYPKMVLVHCGIWYYLQKCCCQICKICYLLLHQHWWITVKEMFKKLNIFCFAVGTNYLVTLLFGIIQKMYHWSTHLFWVICMENITFGPAIYTVHIFCSIRKGLYIHLIVNCCWNMYFITPIL